MYIISAMEPLENTDSPWDSTRATGESTKSGWVIQWCWLHWIYIYIYTHIYIYVCVYVYTYIYTQYAIRELLVPVFHMLTHTHTHCTHTHTHTLHEHILAEKHTNHSHRSVTENHFNVKSPSWPHCRTASSKHCRTLRTPALGLCWWIWDSCTCPYPDFRHRYPWVLKFCWHDLNIPIQYEPYDGNIFLLPHIWIAINVITHT